MIKKYSARPKMTHTDLIKVLEGDFELLSTIDDYLFPDEEKTIYVYPEHVKKVINSFLQHKITAYQLQRWARIINTPLYFAAPDVDYSPPENQHQSDITAAYYETMWQVIERLSTPFIDGELTEDRVSSYLKELNKYK